MNNQSDASAAGLTAAVDDVKLLQSAAARPGRMDRARAGREAAKARRRAQIIEAARVLIRESGDTGFSMRALADRASVSLATPYNLLGSKHEVLTALLDSDINRYQNRLRRSDGDALDMLFNAIRLSRQFYAREPHFYRAVLGAVYGEGADYRTMFRAPRRALWRWLVQQAIDEGFLAERVETEPFSINLVMIFFAAIMEWITGEISLAEMELRVEYGFAISLLAVARQPSRARLEARLYETQSKLARFSKL
jgi:AcrR family transcriptional regulator